MDEQERRRRLRSYGFSAAERLNVPPADRAAGSARGGARHDPAHETQETADRSPLVADAGTVTATRPSPSVLARILDSLGFRFGLTVLILGFVAGVLTTLEALPAGPFAEAVAAFFGLTLTPAAVTSWMAAGVLAPPAPFRTGLLLGLCSAVLLAVLLLVADTGSGDARVPLVLGYAVANVIVATFATGFVGWIVRRVFMPPGARRPFREQAGLEPRSRPWPPLAIALAFVSLPLIAFTNEATEWIFAAAFGSLVTVAMIRGGLDVQRAYPERRTPVIVVGLFAGIVAGLAMLQAIWSESRWPERRVSSDRIAIGVSVLLVVAAAYAAEPDVYDTWPAGQAYVVQPASDGLATAEDVALTRDILEARLTALAIEARLSAGDDGRITVELAEDADEDLVYRVLGSVGLLEFTPVPASCAIEVLQDAPQPACLDETEPLFDGREVATARIGLDRATGQIVVNVELTDTAARLFDEYAAQVHDKPDPYDRLFAIVLDGEVASAPSINAPRFGGQAQISGDFTVDEASALVAALQAGRSLPYAVSVSAKP